MKDGEIANQDEAMEVSPQGSRGFSFLVLHRRGSKAFCGSKLNKDFIMALRGRDWGNSQVVVVWDNDDQVTIGIRE